MSSYTSCWIYTYIGSFNYSVYICSLLLVSNTLLDYVLISTYSFLSKSLLSMVNYWGIDIPSYSSGISN